MNLEPYCVEQENSHFAQDCSLHWLHHQGGTFLLKASLQFYHIFVREIVAVHIVHTISYHHLLGKYMIQIHALDVLLYVH